ncbi:MAG: C4-type zinc ribbon domain-containing protein [Verrucomicrobiota bacterium]
MQDTLTNLLILQDRDLRKMQIESDLQRIPKEEEHIELTLKTQSADYEKHKKAAQQIEVQRKELDNEVKAKEAKIAKYQTQQMETKKNEEYQALGHEIDRTKQEISDTEDQELQLMEDYDEAMKEVEAEAVHVKEYETAAQTRRQALVEKKTNLESELEKLNVSIGEAEAKCDKADMSIYRRLLKSKGDVAIVKIEHGNMCSGCHMTLTQQEIVQAKGGQIVHCSNCGRILFYQNEFA